jgi:hypothetical protein
MSTLRRLVPPPGTESETPAPVRPAPPTYPATPVLVDSSGRRQRRVRLAARIVVLCLLGYMALAGVLLLVRPGLVPLGLPGLGPSTHKPADKVTRPSPAGKTTAPTPARTAQPVPRTGFSPTAPAPTSPAPLPAIQPSTPPTSFAPHAHGPRRNPMGSRARRPVIRRNRPIMSRPVRPRNPVRPPQTRTHTTRHHPERSTRTRHTLGTIGRRPGRHGHRAADQRFYPARRRRFVDG